MAGKVRRIRLSAICWLAAFAAAAGVASAGSGSPYPSDEGTKGPFAPKDCAYPRERPIRLVLKCDGFDAIVNRINWKNWGKRRARGSGKFELRNRVYAANFEIRGVRKRLCGDERLPMFTRINLDFKGKRPNFDTSRKLKCSLLDSGWSP